MKKIIFSIVILLSICNSAFALSVLEYNQADMTYSTLEKYYYNGLSNPPSFQTTSYLQLVVNVAYNDNFRIFVELNLDPWYATGLSSSNIQKVELSLRNSYSSGSPSTINTYAMTSNEDGIITTSESQYESGTELIQSNITPAEYDPDLVISLTGADLHLFTDDIDNSNSHSGFAIRLTDESNVTQYVFFDSNPHAPEQQLPFFKIYYEDSAIPEPATLILLGLGLVGVFIKKRG